MTTRDDLKNMTPEQVVAAHENGEFDALLGIDPNLTEVKTRAKTGRINLEDVRTLHKHGHDDLIETARLDGRINLEGINR